MKLTIVGQDKQKSGDVTLPKQFEESVRPDLIRRAVVTIQANRRIPYGASPMAGMQHSTNVSRRRRKYRGSYGRGISRIPRKVMSRSGTQFNFTGAEAPGTVGGRRAHAPKASKIWSKKINVNENRKALRSALAASLNVEFNEKRGHKVPKEFPFVIETSFEEIKNTKNVYNILGKLGLQEELARASKKNIRAGKGKARGRRYKARKGPLFVVSKECSLSNALSNIPGVEVVPVAELNCEYLAPGGDCGRLTFYTDAALNKITSDKLFTNKVRKIKLPKAESEEDSKKE